jgi:hypothetical protein
MGRDFTFLVFFFFMECKIFLYINWPIFFFNNNIEKRKYTFQISNIVESNSSNQHCIIQSMLITSFPSQSIKNCLAWKCPFKSKFYYVAEIVHIHLQCFCSTPPPPPNVTLILLVSSMFIPLSLINVPLSLVAQTSRMLLLRLSFK